MEITALIVLLLLLLIVIMALRWLEASSLLIFGIALTRLLVCSILFSRAILTLVIVIITLRTLSISTFLASFALNLRLAGATLAGITRTLADRLFLQLILSGRQPVLETPNELFFVGVEISFKIYQQLDVD